MTKESQMSGDALDEAYERGFKAGYEVALAAQSAAPVGEDDPFRLAVIEECARFADRLTTQDGRPPEWYAATHKIPGEIRRLAAPPPSTPQVTCPHDMGFDNELGPIGCRLVGHEMECVCEYFALAKPGDS